MVDTPEVHVLEIDRAQDDERPAPSAGEAELARKAAQDTLDALPGERERLTARIAECVSLGDFEGARATRDALSLLEDRATFAAGQLKRAELAVLVAEGAQAERDATQAARELEQAFAREESARQAYQEASSLRAGAQARMQSYQVRLESLRQKHAEARRRLEQNP